VKKKHKSKEMFFALGGACLGEVVGEVMAQLACEP